jgi:hypothetical protein
MQNRTWNRCDDCGRFIALGDFDNGAIRRLIYPDSDRSVETWETLCRDHADLRPHTPPPPRRPRTVFRYYSNVSPARAVFPLTAS